MSLAAVLLLMAANPDPPSSLVPKGTCAKDVSMEAEYGFVITCYQASLVTILRMLDRNSAWHIVIENPERCFATPLNVTWQVQAGPEDLITRYAKAGLVTAKKRPGQMQIRCNGTRAALEIF